MELLIPGLILVALMVYASTKIKKTAAMAFEAETVETDKFRVEKPEGFLNVLNLDSMLEFEAYSKEYGEGDAKGTRAARAELRFYKDRKLKYATDAIRELVTVKSDTPEIIDGRKYQVIEGASEDGELRFNEIYKLTEKDGGVYEFKLKVLDDAEPELVKRAEMLFSGFELK